MAHWFHRNPLKATGFVTFELRGVAANGQAQKICSDLRMTRSNLLDILANPNNEISLLTETLNTYLSLLHGFKVSLDDKNPGDSKMRHAIKFRWTNTLSGNTPDEQQDILYEEMSMLFNVALWYTKHAAKLAGKDEPSMEEAKELHRCLRLGAGIFTLIKDQLLGRLIESPEKGADLDPRILSAFIHQSTAEAQEVTIARAIELKHNSTLTSALAYETAKMFTAAVETLSDQDEKLVGKWKKYLQFKTDIYYAYAFNFHGETLLAQDKCGEAIKCLEESNKHYERAGKLGKDYSSVKGTGTTAKPQNHLFYRKLGPVVTRTLEKCSRENGFIYHQKVPVEVPELELKATYGLVAPEEFSFPDASPLWTPETYAAFDITKMPKPDPKEENREKKDLPPVKEKDVPQSDKDPKNHSGCVVS